jgi:hypothetical protein
MLLIWITTDVDVAVKLAGVMTLKMRPVSLRVEVDAEATVTGVDVVDEGVEPPEQPVVKKVLVEEVAALLNASRDTTRYEYNVHATNPERGTE